MTITRHIRKIIFICCWCAAGVGMLVLLIAAIKVKNHHTCSGYAIDIRGGDEQPFIDKKEVIDILTGNGGEMVKGKSLQKFNLSSMEDRLERNPWIKDAELFFDNNQVLQVRIEERKPVARIFTGTGYSFYIDSSGEHLPLSDKFSARLPVFTGFPADKPKPDHADSILGQHIELISSYLLHHPFWMAQIAQVDILPGNTFELTPVVGNHVIVFGDGTDADKKFNRLMIFYKKVLSKTGMDAYQRINVQYERQVVAVKK